MAPGQSYDKEKMLQESLKSIRKQIVFDPGQISTDSANKSEGFSGPFSFVLLFFIIIMNNARDTNYFTNFFTNY